MNKTGFMKLGEYLQHNWLVLACLIVTATRTWDIVKITSPVWWLPWAGVLIMEGSFFFWNGRVEHAKRTAQRVIAIVATALTWITILLTVLADVFYRARLGNFINASQMPAWVDTVAVVSVVTVAMLHVALQVFYKYIDPEQELERQHREEVRLLEYEGRKTQLDMERAEIQAQVESWREVMARAGKLFGTLTFRQRFFDKYKMHPEDLTRREVSDMLRVLDKVPKLPANVEQTPVQPSLPASDNGKVPVDQGRGPDHGNF